MTTDVLMLARALGHPCPEADAAFLQDLAKNIAAPLRAQIDRLMLEYCPDEMTPDQLANWAAHQKAFVETPAKKGEETCPDLVVAPDPWAMPVVRPEFHFSPAERERIETAFDKAIRNSPVLSAYYRHDHPTAGK